MPVQDRSTAPRAAQVAVIGGGASGCMAAIAAARAGCSVILFEKNEKIAKKIYATGNGRCNLTNLRLDASCYHGGSVPRIMDWISRFPREDLLAFFAEAGVLVHDRDGYVYPRTDQAETVARALEKTLRQLSVRILTGCDVVSVRHREESETGGFCITCEEADGDRDRDAAASQQRDRDNKDRRPGRNRRGRSGPEAAETGNNSKNSNGIHSNRKKGLACKAAAGAERRASEDRSAGPVGRRVYLCDAVVLCTGGLAGPSFGCSGDGYAFAENLGHEIVSPRPALTKLVCADPLLKRAAGVRCHAAVTLYKAINKEDLHKASAVKGRIENDQVSSLKDTGFRKLAREEGELQITDNSLSGIPVFQLSGLAAEALAGEGRLYAEIDFLPEFGSEAYAYEIERRLQEDRGQMLGDLLLGLAHRKVIDLVLASANLQAEMKAARLDDDSLRSLLHRFRAYVIEVTGTGSYDHAQVTAGGVSLDLVREDLSSTVCPGLFFAGELLDVDGRCGGYNLQWAMSSGTLAGRAASDFCRQSGSGRI